VKYRVTRCALLSSDVTYLCNLSLLGYEWRRPISLLLHQAAVTIYVPYDGVVKELMYEVNDTATKGKPLLTVEVEEDESEGEWCSCIHIIVTSSYGVGTVLSLESPSGSKSKVEQDAPIARVTQNVAKQQQQPNKTLITPAVRSLAEKHGVNLSAVQGSGKDGRVLKEDILTLIEAMKGEAKLNFMHIKAGNRQLLCKSMGVTIFSIYVHSNFKASCSCF